MPVALLQAEPGLQIVKHSPLARRTPETAPAIAVLITALVTAPAAAPAQPVRPPVINTTASMRNVMLKDLLRLDMFFDRATF